ncbi:MAG: Ig-like domain-containing protein [Planctomycetota bacterium]
MKLSLGTVLLAASCCFLLIGLPSCGGSSVGSLFDGLDRGDDGDGDGDGGGTGNLEPGAPVDGGRSIPGRPFIQTLSPGDQVQDAHPEAPIVLHFNETINRLTLTDDTFFVRAQGGTALAGSIRMFAGDRVAALLLEDRLTLGVTYEIVVSPEGIGDLDGEALNAPEVLSTFRVGTSEPALAVQDVAPAIGEVDVSPSTNIIAFLNEAVDVASVNSQSIQVDGFSGTVDLDDDGRILIFNPTIDLPLATPITWRVRAGLRDTDLSGTVLTSDFPASFQTTSIARPTNIVAITPPMGTDPVTGRPASFISLANETDYEVDVTVPGSAQPGDTVVLSFSVPQTSQRALFEQTLQTAGGTVRFRVDLSGADLDDGIVSLAAWIERGGSVGNFFVDSDLVIRDTVPPQLLELGPPVGSNAGAFLSPLRELSVYGTANEALDSITLTLPGPGIEVGLFDQVLEPILAPPGVNSFFMSEPFDLGNRTGEVGFNLVLRDAAGNETEPTTGTTVQPRGVVGGGRVSVVGSLSILAYDPDTLRGLSGATVVVQSVANPGGAGVRRTADSLGRVTIPAGELPGSEPYIITAHRFSGESTLDSGATTIYSVRASIVHVPVPLRLGSIGVVSGTADNLPPGDVTGGAGVNLGLNTAANVTAFNVLLPTFDIDVFPNGMLALTGFGAPTFPPTDGGAAFSSFTTQFPLRPAPPDGSAVGVLDFDVPAPAALTTAGGPTTTLTFEGTGLNASALEDDTPAVSVVAPVVPGGFEGLVPIGLGVPTLIAPPRADTAPAVDDAGTVAVFQQFVPKNPDGSGDTEIFAIDLGTMALTQITNNTVNDSRPRISRDGAKVVWESGPSGSTSIRIADIDGSNQVLLAVGAGGTSHTRPVVSNDIGSSQRWVVWEALAVFGTDQDIARILVDDSDNSVVAPVEDLTTNGATDRSPAIDATALRVFYISDEDIQGDDDLNVLNTSSMTRTSLPVAGSDEASPTCSADGAIFAITSSSLGQGSGIAVAQFSNPGNFIALSLSPLSDDRAPQLSGDGTTITFERITGSAPEVYVATDFNFGSLTATVRRITQNPQRDQQPVLVGDGSVVLFSSNQDDDFEIYSALTDNPLPIPSQLTDQSAQYSYEVTYALEDPNHLDSQTQQPLAFEDIEVEIYAEDSAGNLSIARRAADTLPMDLILQTAPTILEPTPGQVLSLTGATVTWSDDLSGPGVWIVSLTNPTGRVWTIYVPANIAPSIVLPDVRTTASDILTGAVSVRVSARHLDAFDINRFRFSDLSRFRDRSDSATRTVTVPQ